MTKFYMTYNRQSPVYKLEPWINENDVPIMTNAASCWSNRTNQFNSMATYDGGLAIDSGGYNNQADYVDRSGDLKVESDRVAEERETPAPFYDWTVEEYHEWLSQNSDKFEKAFVMDYACEERFDTLWSVDSRVDATVANTIRHFELEPDYNLIPVLQGRSVDEYVQCYKKLMEAGIPTEEVGLGTVCRLSSSREIVRVEDEIRERTGVERIHGFGVKIDAYRMGASFETADSHAWVYDPSNGRVRTIHRDDSGELSIDRTQYEEYSERKFHSFKTYYAYVTSIIDGESAVSVDGLIQRQREMGVHH